LYNLILLNTIFNPEQHNPKEASGAVQFPLSHSTGISPDLPHSKEPNHSIT
jgi:hypothetical protein